MKEGLVGSDSRSHDEILLNKKVMARRVAKAEGTSVQCVSCNNYYMPDEVVETDDGMLCPECSKKGVCDCCDNRFDKSELSELRDLDDTVQYKSICEDCKMMLISEADAEATVFYDDDVTPYTITTYENMTDGDFRTVWHNTGGWRGHFDIECSDDWENVHDDAILSYSADAEELKKFDDEFQSALRVRGIRYARVFSRTSNVFCTGYDFFVQADKKVEALAIRVVLAVKYRDPVRFNATALTGKDPDEWLESDMLFMKAISLVDKGFDAEEAVKKVLEDEDWK